MLSTPTKLPSDAIPDMVHRHFEPSFELPWLTDTNDLTLVLELGMRKRLCVNAVNYPQISSGPFTNCAPQELTRLSKSCVNS